MDLVLLLLITAQSPSVERVRLSTYAPGDGYNAGQLACGGIFNDRQLHIAHRRWRKLGCKRAVVVYSRATGRVAAARVMDAGPFGITDDKGKWRVWTRSYVPPKGWRFRGGVDLSIALWKRLGRPQFLSRARLFFVDERLWQLVRVVNELFFRDVATPTAYAPLLGRRRNLPSTSNVLEAGPHAVEDAHLWGDHAQRTKALLGDSERLREYSRLKIELFGLPQKVACEPCPPIGFLVDHRCCVSHGARVAADVVSATLRDLTPA
jgi:hypothetical protein